MARNALLQAWALRQLIGAYKAVTEHVRQWKDTLAAMEHGDPTPWPIFVGFIRLRGTSASHCMCGTSPRMGVCEDIVLWDLPRPACVFLAIFGFETLLIFKGSARRNEEGGRLGRKGLGGGGEGEVRSRDRDLPWSCMARTVTPMFCRTTLLLRLPRSPKTSLRFRGPHWCAG